MNPEPFLYTDIDLGVPNCDLPIEEVETYVSEQSVAYELPPETSELHNLFHDGSIAV